MPFIAITSIHNGKLLFRLDPNRGIIEIRQRGVCECIDLVNYGMKPCDPKPEPYAHMAKVAERAREA